MNLTGTILFVFFLGEWLTVSMIGLVAATFVLQSGNVFGGTNTFVVTGNGHGGTCEARGRTIQIKGNDSRITVRGKSTFRRRASRRREG